MSSSNHFHTSPEDESNSRGRDSRVVPLDVSDDPNPSSAAAGSENDDTQISDTVPTPANDFVADGTPAHADVADSDPSVPATAAGVPNQNNTDQPRIPQPRTMQYNSITTGTTIFSFDPTTGRLTPIAGTIPVTRYNRMLFTSPNQNTEGTEAERSNAPADQRQGAEPLSAAAPGSPLVTQNSWTSTGADFTTQQVTDQGPNYRTTTNLSFTSLDGRPLPANIIQQVLASLGGGPPNSLNRPPTQNPTQPQPPTIPATSSQQTAEGSSQASSMNDRPFRNAEAVFATQFPPTGLSDYSIPRPNIPIRTRSHSAPDPPGTLPSSSQSPADITAIPQILLHEPIPRSSGMQAASQPQPPPGSAPDLAENDMNQGANVPAWGSGPAQWIPVLPPWLQLPAGGATAAPGAAFAPAFGVGMPFGLAGAFAGLGGGLDAPRPPDTRRAKELLRGLTLVDQGLVKRLERVNTILGDDLASTGNLLCAVCYDPLLKQEDGHNHEEGDQPGTPLEKEDAMDLDDEDSGEPSTAEPQLESTVKEGSSTKNQKEPKSKPRHPSLSPNALIALPCTHVFHAVSCLLPWFEQGKTTCPTCRFDVDPNSDSLDLARWLGRGTRRATAAPPTPAAQNSAQAPMMETTAAPIEQDGEGERGPAHAPTEEAPSQAPHLTANPDAGIRDAIARALRNAFAQTFGMALSDARGTQAPLPASTAAAEERSEAGPGNINAIPINIEGLGLPDDIVGAEAMIIDMPGGLNPPPAGSDPTTPTTALSQTPTTPMFHIPSTSRLAEPSSTSARMSGSRPGSSSSNLAAASSSRPSTPHRHHPYANARPPPSGSNLNSEASLPSTFGPNNAEMLPQTPTPDGQPAAAQRSGLPGYSITRHSITIDIPLNGPASVNFFGPGFAGGIATATPNSGATDVNTGSNPDTTPGFDPTRLSDWVNNIFRGAAAGIFNDTLGAGGHATPSNRPKKKWVAPDGTSLRSVVESKERQAGLRCDDVSCLRGPEDDDEENGVDIQIHPERVSLLKSLGGNSETEASCAHRFHPECLLVSARVGDAALDSQIDEESETGLLEVACPLCRRYGGLSRQEWKASRERANAV